MSSTNRLISLCDFTNFNARQQESDLIGKEHTIVDVKKTKNDQLGGSNLVSKTVNTRLLPVDLVNDYYPFIDFKFVFPHISPKLDKARNIFMIVLVNSGAKGERFRKNRETIRETWGNQSNCEQREAMADERLKDLRWILVFVVGKAGPETNDDELNVAEARKYNDMLIGNITDNYLNNIVKLYMGLVWASRFDTKYVLKTDDDVYVRVPRVLEYIVNAKFPSPFCGGVTFVRRNKVPREIGHKFTISYKYYAKEYFPNFNPGCFFVFFSNLLNKLFNYVYERKPFRVDDAYVGLAMQDFGVKITKINSFVLRKNSKNFFKSTKDCKILNIDAFGHNIDPEFSRSLHNRIGKLACGRSKIKC